MFSKARFDTLSDGIFGVALNSRVALWALALNFAVPLIRKWDRPAEVSD